MIEISCTIQASQLAPNKHNNQHFDLVDTTSEFNAKNTAKIILNKYTI